VKVGRVKNEKGFTIIETLLVLAVSSVLIGTTIYATYQMIFSSRFTDTMSSAASWIQNQYEEARSGVRPHNCSIGVSAAGQSDSILLGKLITFEQTAGTAADQLHAYYVIGETDVDIENTTTEITGTNGTNTDVPAIQPVITSIAKADPRVLSCGVESTELEWQAKFVANADGSNPGFTYTDETDNAANFNGDWGAEGGNWNSDFWGVLLLRNSNSATITAYNLVGKGGGDQFVAVDTRGYLIDPNTNIDANGNWPGGSKTLALTLTNTGTATGISGGLVQAQKGALIIENGDSKMYRDTGAVCIDPSANSTAVYSVRSLGVGINGDGTLDWGNGADADSPTNKMIKTVETRCED
jgi:prepilin-type N-terminal cleavage/methylation domain-containing protein